MACIIRNAHEIARDERAAWPNRSYRDCFKIGMKIAWRRFQDATRDFDRGLVNGFNV